MILHRRETMLSTDEPDLFCVMCGWENEAAYQQWQDSPLRAKQVEDLAGMISADIRTLQCRTYTSIDLSLTFDSNFKNTTIFHHDEKVLRSQLPV